MTIINGTHEFVLIFLGFAFKADQMKRKTNYFSFVKYIYIYIYPLQSPFTYINI